MEVFWRTAMKTPKSFQKPLVTHTHKHTHKPSVYVDLGIPEGLHDWLLEIYYRYLLDLPMIPDPAVVLHDPSCKYR